MKAVDEGPRFGPGALDSGREEGRALVLVPTAA
jgi:hypothetical protein